MPWFRSQRDLGSPWLSKANAKSLIWHKLSLQKARSAKQCLQPAHSHGAALSLSWHGKGSTCFADARTGLSKREAFPVLSKPFQSYQSPREQHRRHLDRLSLQEVFELSGWAHQHMHSYQLNCSCLTSQQEVSAVCVYTRTHTGSTVGVTGVAGAGKCWYRSVYVPVRRITVMINWSLPWTTQSLKVDSSNANLLYLNI